MNKHKRPTQCDRVMQYLREFGELTTLDAITDIGVLRLGARISELRSRGIAIKTGWRTVKTRYGKNTSIAVYTLIENEAAV